MLYTIRFFLYSWFPEVVPEIGHCSMREGVESDETMDHNSSPLIATLVLYCQSQYFFPKLGLA